MARSFDDFLIVDSLIITSLPLDEHHVEVVRMVLLQVTPNFHPAPPHSLRAILSVPTTVRSRVVLRFLVGHSNLDSGHLTVGMYIHECTWLG